MPPSCRSVEKFPGPERFWIRHNSIIQRFCGPFTCFGVVQTFFRALIYRRVYLQMAVSLKELHPGISPKLYDPSSDNDPSWDNDPSSDCPEIHCTCRKQGRKPAQKNTRRCAEHGQSWRRAACVCNKNRVLGLHVFKRVSRTIEILGQLKFTVNFNCPRI